MQKLSFFKILNNKIKKYDKAAQNPFENQRLVIIWVEDVNELSQRNDVHRSFWNI